MATVNLETNSRFNQEQQPVMDNHKSYQLPSNYNPDDYPPVKLRNNNADKSETQRKRRSKNRLSNRRSTGFVSKDDIDEAMKIGSNNGDNCMGTTPTTLAKTTNH